MNGDTQGDTAFSLETEWEGVEIMLYEEHRSSLRNEFSLFFGV